MQPAEVSSGRRAQGAGGFHEEKDELVVLPALGVVVVARVVGHAADVARVRPSLVPAARADTSDFANSVLEGVAEAGVSMKILNSTLLNLQWRRGRAFVAARAANWAGRPQAIRLIPALPLT